MYSCLILYPLDHPHLLLEIRTKYLAAPFGYSAERVPKHDLRTRTVKFRDREEIEGQAGDIQNSSEDNSFAPVI